jgi:hypothetical protein
LRKWLSGWRKKTTLSSVAGCRRSGEDGNNIFISSEHVLTLSFVHSLLALHIVISIAKKAFKAVTS